MRLAEAGEDLSLSHAKIGRSGVASRGNAARTKTAMPAAKASLTRRPVRERIRILVAPKPGVIMAVQPSGARFQVFRFSNDTYLELQRH